MGDREGRALGAGESFSVTVDGEQRDYLLSPVVARNLCEVEREALKFYKRSVLETFTDNQDLLPENSRDRLIERKFDEVSVMTVADLPQRPAYDVSKVAVNDSLLEFLQSEYEELPESRDGKRALVAHALDTNRITSEKIFELTETKPIKGSIRFDQWWITGTLEGMIYFIANGLRRWKPDTTIQDRLTEVKDWPFIYVNHAARKLEHITSAAVGNGLGSPNSNDQSRT